MASVIAALFVLGCRYSVRNFKPAVFLQFYAAGHRRFRIIERTYLHVIATDLDRIREYKDERLCWGEVEGMGGEAIIKFQPRSGPSKTLTAPLRDVGVVNARVSERAGAGGR